MVGQRWIAVVLLTLVACGRGISGEPAPDGFLQRLAPAGGWSPYGGGLLRWWPCDCFPCVGAPDDYCRKSLPCVCWPPYPPYYIWGPPQSCSSEGNCRQSCGGAR